MTVVVSHHCKRSTGQTYAREVGIIKRRREQDKAVCNTESADLRLLARQYHAPQCACVDLPLSSPLSRPRSCKPEQTAPLLLRRHSANVGQHRITSMLQCRRCIHAAYLFAVRSRRAQLWQRPSDYLRPRCHLECPALAADHQPPLPRLDALRGADTVPHSPAERKVLLYDGGQSQTAARL